MLRCVCVPVSVPECVPVCVSGMLGRLFGAAPSTTVDTVREAERREAEQIEVIEFVSALKEMAWVPVLPSPPLPFLPWPSSSPLLLPLEKPAHVRPVTDMWLCSYSRRLLDGTITSPGMKWFFDWDDPLPASGALSHLHHCLFSLPCLISSLRHICHCFLLSSCLCYLFHSSLHL